MSAENPLANRDNRDSQEGTASAMSATKKAEALKQRLEAFRQIHRFAVGELVAWKPGLRNRKAPQYDEPAIVVDVLAEPIVLDKADPFSLYFREALDILLGVIDRDGDFLVFHFDSRRFQPLPDQPKPKRRKRASSNGDANA